MTELTSSPIRSGSRCEAIAEMWRERWRNRTHLTGGAHLSFRSRRCGWIVVDHGGTVLVWNHLDLERLERVVGFRVLKLCIEDGVERREHVWCVCITDVHRKWRRAIHSWWMSGWIERQHIGARGGKRTHGKIL